MWQLLPDNPTVTPINTMVIHEAFCVTGSDDGLLRVWPLDFSNVILEVGEYGVPFVSKYYCLFDGLVTLAVKSVKHHVNVKLCHFKKMNLFV